MATPTFNQRSRLGRTLFQVNGEYLEITTSLWGEKKEKLVLLRSIDINYERSAKRVYWLILIPLFAAAACSSLIRAILNQEVFPHEVAIWPSVLLPFLLIQAVRGVLPIELIRFRDQWKRELFVIIREKPQGDDCDTFLIELLAHIEMTANGTTMLKPDDNVATAPASFRYQGAPAAFDFKTFARWKCALLLGSLSAGIPQISGVPELLGLLAIPVIVFLSMGGIVFGVLSLFAKEPQRPLAALAIALSLIAPIFY